MKPEPSLTERELEILAHVATGASNREIAQALHISTNTVKVHLSNIFQKLQVASRTEATLYAIQAGLVPGVEAEPTGAKRPWWSRWWVLAGGALMVAAVAVAAALLVRPEVPPTQPAVDLEALERERWQELAPMPTARKGMAVAAYDGKIYAIGGETAQGVTDIVERYDPATDSWEALPPKPTAVTDVQAAVIGGKIFVPGGMLASGAVTDVLEIFDPITGRWTNAHPMPVALSRFGLQAYEGEMYIFGGWNGRKPSAEALKFTPATDEWNPLVGDGVARADPGVLLFGNEFFLLGGEDESHFLRGIEIYLPDQATGSDAAWRTQAQMPTANAGMGVASFADIIYVIGGGGSPGRFFRFIPRTDEWREVETPVDTFGNNVRIVALEDFIYIFNTQSELGDFLRYRAVYTVFIPFLLDSEQ